MEVSFTSTYRIPMHIDSKLTGGKKVEQLSKGAKGKLKELADEFGGIYPDNGSGNVRFSTGTSFDTYVKNKLRSFGIKWYKEVPEHNVPKNELDAVLDASKLPYTKH